MVCVVRTARGEAGGRCVSNATGRPQAMHDDGMVWQTLQGYVWDACGAGIVHVCTAVSGVQSPVRLVAAWATVCSVQASCRCHAHLVLCACTVQHRQRCHLVGRWRRVDGSEMGRGSGLTWGAAKESAAARALTRLPHHPNKESRNTAKETSLERGC